MTPEPDTAEDFLALARTQYAAGAVTDALMNLDRAIALDAGNAQAWLMMGVIRGVQGDYKAAESCCCKAIAQQPELVEAHMNLAAALERQDELADAAFSYRTVTELRPEAVGAWIQLGRIHARSGKLEDSETCARRAIALQPTLPDAHLLLGASLAGQNKLDEAALSYQEAIRLNPDNAEAYARLGILQQTLGNQELAEASYKNALRLDPPRPLIHFNLAVLQQARRQTQEAESSYREAIRFNRDYLEAHNNLGILLKEQGHMEDAADAFQEVLRIDPLNSQARFLVSALISDSKPETAPADYVARIFDDVADRFDEELVQNLDYRTPQYLEHVVNPLLANKKIKIDILDLGCGTGLCAPLFRNMANRLIGIDLSRKMIEKARERNLYDELYVEDIVTHLQSFENTFDLVLAADVFVYIGDLEQIFQLVSERLRSGGIFAFSVEESDSSAPYSLKPTSRYGHSTDYIRSLSHANGLKEVGYDYKVLRKEGNKPVTGHIFAFRLENPPRQHPKTTGLGVGLRPGDEHYRAYVGPPNDFDLVSAMVFNLLTSIGLRQHHRVLDIGCGSLRIGRLLIPYLNPGNYVGVEPNKWLVEDGILNEIGRDMVRIKIPVFSFRPSMEEFSSKLNIDYAIAQSIFSHCGTDLIRDWLSQSAFHLKDSGALLATFLVDDKDYDGCGWVYPGCARYKPESIAEIASECDLDFEIMDWVHPRQTWALFSKKHYDKSLIKDGPISWNRFMHEVTKSKNL